MITECLVWRGAHPMLYQEDLARWSSEQADSFNPPIRLDASQIKADSAETARALADDGGWVAAVRTVVVHSAQQWNADDYKKIVKHLKDAETEFRLSFVFESGKAPKSINDLATDAERDYLVPEKKELKKLPEWLGAQLQRHNVKADRALLTKTANYVGEDASAAVDVVMAMRRYAGKKITWSEVEPVLGERGSVAYYQITSEIASGNIEKALDTLDRLFGHYPELKILYNIKVKFQSYLTVVSSRKSIKELAEATGMNEWALKYAVQEARQLGQDRVIKGMLLIAETDRALKGEKSISGPDALRHLVIRLTRMFELAKR